MTEQAFRLDMETIRKRAREQMSDGAVTGGYHADRAQVIDVLNSVLATEIICHLRYMNHYFVSSGINAPNVAGEFLEHANEEHRHAIQVAERIDQLDGEPNFNPDSLLTRGHAEYKTSESLTGMIQEDLVAERIAIETYSEIVRWLGDRDPTTRRVMEEILAKEEEHADDLRKLLERVEGGIH